MTVERCQHGVEISDYCDRCQPLSYASAPQGEKPDFIGAAQFAGKLADSPGVGAPLRNLARAYLQLRELVVENVIDRVLAP